MRSDMRQWCDDQKLDYRVERREHWQHDPGDLYPKRRGYFLIIIIDDDTQRQ
jgi:hypothetical protein